MSNPNDIAIVITHGSYHTPVPYAPFITALQSQGFETHCPQRPTCDLANLNVGNIQTPDFTRPPPDSGYPTDADDVAVFTTLLDKLIKNEKKHVLLAAHSSGGWVATQAAIPEYQAKVRKERGEEGGIVGIFYFGAFIIPVRESTNGLFLKHLDPNAPRPPYSKVFENGLTTFTETREYLFHDIPLQDAEKYAATLTASPIMPTILTNDAYSALPCAYVVLDNDRILPKGFQETMVESERQRGNKFRVFHAPAGHSPQLSWTQGLVGFVGVFLDEVRG
ncbi:alpha/beta-hydrolase [Aspergillus crustosus]